jgi:toxin secretion/phage lysis holin
MERLDVLFKTLITGLGALSGFLWGEWSALLQILLAFTVIDYITGIIASGTEGKLSSQVGFKGIAKKVMIFVIVAVGHLVDKAIGEGSVVQNMVIFFYLGNELLSILENAGRVGLPVPEQIKNTVQVLKGKGDK